MIVRGIATLAILCGIACFYLALTRVDDESAVSRSAKAYFNHMIERTLESHADAGAYKRPRTQLTGVEVAGEHARVNARIDGSLDVALLLQRTRETGRWNVLGVESIDGEGLQHKVSAAEPDDIEAELRTAFDGREGIAIQRY